MHKTNGLGCSSAFRVHLRTSWSKNPLFIFRGNTGLADACTNSHVLFGQAISSAILGATEDEAMADFATAWNITYRPWQFHLQFASTGW